MNDSTNTNNVQAVSNPATQTLFRFVSLRNPQLTEVVKENLGFVKRPKNIKGIFDTQIEIWAVTEPKSTIKFQELEIAAANFELEAFKKEKEVENINSDYFSIGKSLSKNQVVDSIVIERVASLPRLTDASLTTLWNNLIYQVVTQKDFYIKEAIIQTLKAIDYVEAYKKYRYQDVANEKLNEAKNAKVILPAKLFVEEASVEDDEDNIFTVQKSKIGSEDRIAGERNSKIGASVFPKILSTKQESRLRLNAEKNLKHSIASIKKSDLQTLKRELEKLQKSYNKSYQQAYNDEMVRYQIEVQPIIDNNNKILENIESTFDAEITSREKRSAYNQVELKDVPEFQFNYRNEINFADLKSQLSLKSLNTFLELFTEFDVSPISDKQTDSDFKTSVINSDTSMHIDNTTFGLLEDYHSYEKVFERLDDAISVESQTLLSILERPQKQYVNLAGVIVPISKTKLVTSGGYSLLSYYKESVVGYNSFLNFSVEVDNASWSLAYAKISALADENEIEETFTNLSVADNMITFPPVFVDKFESISSVKIELYFDNDRECTLELDDLTNNHNYIGVLSFDSNLSKKTAKTDVGSTNTFTPKRFGVRRLGIADYLKVEQSVHAYVPGEVSNIENVMASELRHKSSTKTVKTEDTQTDTTSTETEHISDTTTATRNDMQSEVARELDKQQSFASHANFSKNAVWTIDVGASYANNTAQHDSTRQAVQKSQEVTNRALDRIVSKVSQERIRKITNEFVEENIHEFDNRDGKEHISGVYRWVDKKMKNQIYNYGKRMMFEFMIPEPARLHRLANAGEILTAPQDPRKAIGQWKMANANVDETILQYWADVYNVKLTETPVKTVNQHIDYEYFKLEGDQGQRFKVLTFPVNYAAKSVKVSYGYEFGRMVVSNFKGGDVSLPYVGGDSIDSSFTVDGLNIENSFAFKYQGFGVDSFNVTFDLVCGLSDTYINSWKQLQFDNIIAAYTQADADFQKIKEEQEATQTDKTQNFYRDMEEVVLKHNCIAYLLQDYLAILGRKSTSGTNMENFQVMLDADLDSYAALVKFMEQAFEWTIMDYTFYPYYWADRANWQEMYITESVDPLFRNFLQAGMGRVIVTVKPGFEDAVQFFMNTGKIWNGGEVPVIGDPMYLSIVDELREPAGKPQGKAWITRIPTTLNILQAKSIGLEVTDALPISEENPEDFEVPSEVETASAFGEPKDVVLTGSELPTTLPSTVSKVFVKK